VDAIQIIIVITIATVIVTIIIDATTILVLRKKENAIARVFAMAVTVQIVNGIITTIVAVNHNKGGYPVFRTRLFT
jgi:heme A synthase